MFVDSHCHLNMMVQKNFDAPLEVGQFIEIEKIIEQARMADVIDIITIGTTFQESLNSIAIAQRFEHVFATIGVHPCDAQDNWRHDLQKLELLLQNKKEKKIVAIGETGLDFYHKPFNKKRQEDSFKVHIEVALKNNCALVVHVRDAAQEVLSILEKYKQDLKDHVVIHCFSQKQDFAEQVLDWGFYIGLGGYITYPKNQELRDLLKIISLDRILLETDAPFLPPQKFRGTQNSPAYIPIFAQTIAQVLGVTIQDLAHHTTANAQNLFGI
ncbi:MAG: TatD family hydrolase [bacterium]